VRLAIAIGMFVVIATIGVGMLRGLRDTPRHAGGAAPAGPPPPLPVASRVTFWCETCGTEVLLIRRGTDAPPKHCGEPMLRREEVPRNYS